jgi:hypothetical protein
MNAAKSYSQEPSSFSKMSCISGPEIKMWSMLHLDPSGHYRGLGSTLDKAFSCHGFPYVGGQFIPAAAREKAARDWYWIQAAFMDLKEMLA